MSKCETQRNARLCGSAALFLLATTISKAGTYPCRLSDDIGMKGCLLIGLLLTWIAGILTGHFLTCAKEDNK